MEQEVLTGLAIATMVLYLAASVVQGFGLWGRVAQAKVWLLILGFVAICAHGLLLHMWIDMGSGQNLNIFNMLSLVAWLVSLFVLVVVCFRKIGLIAMIIFPLSALSILLVVLFPRAYIVNTALHPAMLFHIFLSIFSLCVLCFACLLAILLAIQERLLRTHPTGALMQKLPPLESLETLLFQTITLGFILLSVVLVTSFYFYYEMVIAYSVLLQKTVLVLLAWMVFAVLLLGRYFWGWRGRKAIYGTVGGVFLLLIAYFVSKLVLEALM